MGKSMWRARLGEHPGLSISSFSTFLRDIGVNIINSMSFNLMAFTRLSGIGSLKVNSLESMVNC
jgi:hypothetical protein